MASENGDSSGIESAIQQAKALASRLSAATRDKVLAAFKEGLLLCEEEILQANRADVEAAASNGEVPQSLQKRLRLDARKLQSLAAAVDAIRLSPSPLGRCSLATELTPGLHLYRISVPLGAVLVVFEGRPEAFVQIASLALKTGNVCLLKGGKEAAKTNAALHRAFLVGLQSVFTEDVSSSGSFSDDKVPSLSGLIRLISSREEVRLLLQLNEAIELVIPRGGRALLEFVRKNTTIPILGHSAGVCHAYVDADAVRTPERLQSALLLLRDSKLQYVAACNALEILLVHREAADALLPALGQALAAEGVRFKADAAAAKLLPAAATEAAHEEDFCNEWLAPVLSVRVVHTLEEAIDSINKNGSHHTDLILSFTPANVELFMQRVDSADIFCNCSTRFADGFRFGFKAEVGISTSKTHARGPVGLEGLCTYTYRLYGSGHTVEALEAQTADGQDPQLAYTHRPLAAQGLPKAASLMLGSEQGIASFEGSRLLQQ
ncbi:hypothetical protein Efla_005553 [Eimeria flavescens]